MKKQMSFVADKIAVLRAVLTVFCMVAVFYCVSFICHADTVKGAIIGNEVNVRETAGTSATVLEKLSNNDLVDVLAETTDADGNKWYKITTASGVTGYVRSDLIKKATVTVDVTEVNDKTAYISSASANIRQDASTSSGRVANAQGGSKVTIIGEATGADGYKWYQVEFVGNGQTMTGFIRSDLVTFQAPVQEPEITEIEGEMSEVIEEPSEEPSEPVEEPSENTDIPVSGTVSDLDIMEPVSTVEILPQGFEQTELKLGDDYYTVWGKDHFYIMYASAKGGDPQYYLYDASNESYVAYTGLFTQADVAVDVEKEEEGLNFKLISVICIVIIVILAITIGILAYKLANASYDEEEDDDDDEYYKRDDSEIYVDGDDDDEEDDEEDDEYVDFSGDMEIISGQVADEEAVYEEPVYETSAGNATYEDVLETSVYDESAEAEYIADDSEDDEYAGQESDEEDDSDADEEELEAYEVSDNKRKGKKDKKVKKEKKKMSQRFLDYFTVEVDEDDDEEDDDDDNQVKSVSQTKYEEDDDDDDLNFIDL